MNNDTRETKKGDGFHESRDSTMDKQLPKKSFIQKYKFHLLGGTAFLVFLIYVLVSLSGTRKLRVDGERIVVADVTEAPFLDYVDAEGIVQPYLTIKLNSLESGFVKEIVAEDGAMVCMGEIIVELQYPELVGDIEDSSG